MKKFLKATAAICLSAVSCLAFTACGGKKADTVPPDQTEAYSIITKLDLSVDFDGDTAMAKAKNTFTLFPAEARVRVYLYYSETEAESYTEMEEVATDYTEDLDQGKTISADWDTKGRGGFFLARMRYKIDNREWEEKCTEKYYRDYTKAILEPIKDDGSLPLFEDVKPVYRFSETERIFVVEDRSDNPYDCYKKFAEKYSESYNEDLAGEYWVLNFKDSEYRKGTPYPNVYSLIKNEDEQLILSTSVWLFVEDFGVDPLPDPDKLTGIPRCNLWLSLYSANTDGVSLKGKLNLEFGRGQNGNIEKGVWDFINLYIGDFCVGTCYFTPDYMYSTVTEISYAFYYNMFVKELIRNSDIK